MAGIRNTVALEDFSELDPGSYGDLRRAMRRLETHYRDLCDIEFTVERGTLWLLQTRVGKRTAAAAFRIATQLVNEGLITLDEALQRVSGAQLAQLSVPQFDYRGRSVHFSSRERLHLRSAAVGQGCLPFGDRSCLGGAAPAIGPGAPGD